MALVRMKRAAIAEGDDLLGRLWSLALSRAVQEEMAAAVRLDQCRVERRTLAELVEMLPETALICALDEGGGEATGVVVLDAGLMAGMVEAMTTGTISAADRATARDALRRPTRTDAALLAPVLDQALAGLEALAGEEGLSDWARGFRFAATVDGGRGLSLLLEDVGYRVLKAQMDLAGGARSGLLMLAIPEGRGAVTLPVVTDGRFTEALAEQVGGAEVRMEAVLLRLSLPLGAVMALRVGEEVALPRAEIGRIAIEGLDGRQVAAGKLGRQGSLRAIRLMVEPVDAALPGMALPSLAGRQS